MTRNLNSIPVLLFLSFQILLGTSSTVNAQNQQAMAEDNMAILEEAFTGGGILAIHDKLTDEFELNTYGTDFSKLIFANILGGLPIKKIKAIEYDISDSDTVKVRCKLVIAKYLGIFSQPASIKMIQHGNELLIHNLILEGQDGEEIGVTVAVDSDTVTNKPPIDLNSLPRISKAGVITYYEPGMEKVAQQANAKQTQGLKVVQGVLNEPILFNLGVLLLQDTLMNLELDNPVIPVPITSESIEDDEFAGLCLHWAYFHETVEMHLLMVHGMMDPNTRWFRDGLADFASHRVAMQLSPATDSLLMESRYKSYEEIKGNANLLKWGGTGSEKKRSGFEGGPGHYAAAMLFFIDLTDQYGDEVVHKLMADLRTAKKPSSKFIVKQLSKITGEDIKKRIKTY